MTTFNDDDYFDDKNKKIKDYLIEQYTLRLSEAVKTENYETAAKYKKILDKLKNVR